MKVLFLDESGDHNLIRIDPKYPIFVLGGVIIDKDYAEGPLEATLNDFKRDLFGRTDIILHTADITRNKNGFEQLKDSVFRSYFYDKLNSLMRSIPYTVVACVIRKHNHYNRYGSNAWDPYQFSLEVLVERFCFAIEKFSQGLIVAEERGPRLDRDLTQAWLSIKRKGTQYVKSPRIANRIVDFLMKSKSDNIAGLQLADLVVSPIGRHILGKSDKEDWQIIKQKFRRDGHGNIEGHGLVVLPK